MKRTSSLYDPEKKPSTIAGYAVGMTVVGVILFGALKCFDVRYPPVKT